MANDVSSDGSTPKRQTAQILAVTPILRGQSSTEKNPIPPPHTRSESSTIIPKAAASHPPPQQPSPYPQTNKNEIPAPIPQRAAIAPMTSPPIMPTTWNPELGIKFGGPGPGPEGQNQGGQGQGWPPSSGGAGAGSGTWDPKRGFKFG